MSILTAIKSFGKKRTETKTSQPVVGNLANELNANLGGISLSSLRISTDSLYTVYRNNSDVFACIREIALNTGANGHKWENIQNPEADPNQDSVKAAETILAFNQTFRRLKNRLLQDVHIAGTTYLLIQRSVGSDKVIGVQALDPRTMSVVTDQFGNVVRWIQRVKGTMTTYAPTEVIAWKMNDDPNSPVFGFSPLETIIWEVRTDLAAMVSNYSFFQNDAQPAAQYLLEEGIADDEADKVVQMLEDQLRGADKRHKSVVMKGVKEIKTLSFNPKDMEFSVLRKFTTEKVCAALGVPKSILNYTEDVNLANGQEQTKKFWEGTIFPTQEAFAEFINKVLLPAIGIADIKICFNERVFDSREWDEASTRADVQLGILTLNEAREVRRYEPYDEASEGIYVNKPMIYGGIGVTPVEDVGVNFQPDTPAQVDPTASEKRLQGIDPALYAHRAKKG